ncbi:MAG: hypothetical protein NTW19_06065 [Planctomycetota bacterium]|nr:hypothetical protein [Planctomycetota bacterium]
MLSRNIAHVSGWKEQDILAGKIFKESGELKADVAAAIAAMENSQLYYANIAGKPIEHTLSLMRQFKQRFVGQTDYENYDGSVHTRSDPCMVIYDWLKLPDAGALKGNTQEHQAIGFQCSRIKDAAAMLDLAVVAGAQNNRAAINATADDWEHSSEAFAASSDRIAQFCSQMAMLRNVDAKEADAIGSAFEDADLPASRKETPHGATKAVLREGHGGLMYNQMLHIVLTRGGQDCKSGLPLYHDRGLFRYEDLGTNPKVVHYRLALREAAREKKKAKTASKSAAGMPIPGEVPHV